MPWTPVWELDAPSDLIVAVRGEQPPISLPFDAFGASTVGSVSTWAQGPNGH